MLSRGGLFVPSKELVDYIYSCFAKLDFVEKEVLNLSGQSVTDNALYVLKMYGPSCNFYCQFHCEWGVKFASKIVTFTSTISRINPKTLLGKKLFRGSKLANEGNRPNSICDVSWEKEYKANSTIIFPIKKRN